MDDEVKLLEALEKDKDPFGTSMIDFLEGFQTWYSSGRLYDNDAGSSFLASMQEKK